LLEIGFKQTGLRGDACEAYVCASSSCFWDELVGFH